MSIVNLSDEIKKDERIKFSLVFSFVYLTLSVLFRIFLVFYYQKFGLDLFFLIIAGVILDIPIASFFFWISSLIYKISFKLKSKRVFFFLNLILSFGLIFLFFTEYFFFDEFNSRFNSVAVDYLIYPTEVFLNIWQSYNLVLIVSICFLVAFSLTYFLNKKIGMRFVQTYKKTSFYSFLLFLFLIVIIPFNGFNISSDRIKNEISKNGVLSFFYAAYYHNLDYDSFYSTIAATEAFDIARKKVVSKGEEFTNNILNPIERKVSYKGEEKKYNVMVFVMESFGSDFVGALGAKKDFTPEFNKLSKEGILFTNIYSIGNRTVRGLEGILTGFVPLPSESLVKMKFSDNIKTLPQILKAKGYYNYFVYGGRGIFDNMKPFAMRYGFDEFIEQKDYKNPVFKTIWGVCDEEIFNMSLKKAKESYEKNKKFFILSLSVSNHKPYTYPEGRIEEDPKKKKRGHAIKYSDWALGDFFKKAKKEKFYKDTVFIIIADHGARVYGSQEIPIKSYEIPLLIIAPGIKPSLNNNLGSSTDIPSTIMDILNISYISPFFGKSLLSGEKNRWVCLNHNRNVGYYDGKNLIVLGLNKNNYYYEEKEKSKIERIDFKKDNLDLIKKEKEAISLFQTAWEIYKKGIKD